MGNRLLKLMAIMFISALCMLTINIKAYQARNNYKAESTEKTGVVEAMYKLGDDDKKKDENPKIDYSKTSWKIQSLYKDDKQWEKELNRFSKDTRELKNYIGKVTKSQTHLGFALNIKEKLDIKVSKLSAYVKLKRDTNKDSYKYLDMNEDLNKVYSDYMEICSDLELEILKLSDRDYRKLMNNKKISKKYGMYLSDIRRSKDYYLDGKSEDLLVKTSSISNLPGEVYELFANMDKKTNLTPAQYASEIESEDRENRKKAYQGEFLAYNDNINTIAGLLVGQVKKNVFYSSQRGYKSSLDKIGRAHV